MRRFARRRRAPARPRRAHRGSAGPRYPERRQAGPRGSRVEPGRSVARRARTPGRRRRLLFWLGVAVVGAIGIGYLQPIRAYLGTRADVEKARAERTALLRQQGELRRRLALAGTDEFMTREARKLGLVVPGEELFIVKGLGDR